MEAKDRTGETYGHYEPEGRDAAGPRQNWLGAVEPFRRVRTRGEFRDREVGALLCWKWTTLVPGLTDSLLIDDDVDW